MNQTSPPPPRPSTANPTPSRKWHAPNPLSFPFSANFINSIKLRHHNEQMRSRMSSASVKRRTNSSDPHDIFNTDEEVPKKAPAAMSRKDKALENLRNSQTLRSRNSTNAPFSDAMRANSNASNQRKKAYVRDIHKETSLPLYAKWSLKEKKMWDDPETLRNTLAGIYGEQSSWAKSRDTTVAHVERRRNSSLPKMSAVLNVSKVARAKAEYTLSKSTLLIKSDVQSALVFTSDSKLVYNKMKMNHASLVLGKAFRAFKLKRWVRLFGEVNCKLVALAKDEEEVEVAVKKESLSRERERRSLAGGGDFEDVITPLLSSDSLSGGNTSDHNNRVKELLDGRSKRIALQLIQDTAVREGLDLQDQRKAKGEEYIGGMFGDIHERRKTAAHGSGSGSGCGVARENSLKSSLLRTNIALRSDHIRSVDVDRDRRQRNPLDFDDSNQGNSSARWNRSTQIQYADNAKSDSSSPRRRNQRNSLGSNISDQKSPTPRRARDRNSLEFNTTTNRSNSMPRRTCDRDLSSLEDANNNHRNLSPRRNNDRNYLDYDDNDQSATSRRAYNRDSLDDEKHDNQRNDSTPRRNDRMRNSLDGPSGEEYTEFETILNRRAASAVPRTRNVNASARLSGRPKSSTGTSTSKGRNTNTSRRLNGGILFQSEGIAKSSSGLRPGGVRPRTAISAATHAGRWPSSAFA